MNHYNKQLKPIRCIICNYKLYNCKGFYCNKCIHNRYNVYIKIHDYKYPKCCMHWKET